MFDVDYLLSLDGNSSTDLASGDFASIECVAALKEADIVVTNPPFSLFRKFIDLLLECDKYFCIVYFETMVAYQPVFNRVRDGFIFSGYTKPRHFNRKDDVDIALNNIGWLINLPVERINRTIDDLDCYYDSDVYPEYDNYMAIECKYRNKVPKDYYGVIGVPLTYINNPIEGFDIVGIAERFDFNNVSHLYKDGVERKYNCFLNGYNLFKRIFIKRKTAN